MKTQKVTLPADVFDTLDFSALVFGGIKASCLTETDDNGHAVPACIVGHAMFLDGYFEDGPYTREAQIKVGESPICDALIKAFPALAKELEEEKKLLALQDASIYNCILGAIESQNDYTVDKYAKEPADTVSLTPPELNAILVTLGNMGNQGTRSARERFRTLYPSPVLADVFELHQELLKVGKEIGIAT